MTVHRLLTPRWLATGGALLLAGVIGAALLLQNGGSACAAALAAPPGTSAKTGKATFYDMAGGTGNCSLPSIPANDLFVALGNAEYAGAAACGTYLDVTGPKGKVRVKVIDRCPECAAGHLDLSRTAFKKIADEVDGIIKISYKTVSNPPTPAPISVRIKEGSSQYWFAAVIDNHANQLTSVKVSNAGGAFKTATRADYNYWIIDGGAGSGPFKIKITDAYGHTATVSKIKLSPGTTQKTTAHLAGGSSAGEAAPKPEATPAKAKKPSPSPSPSRTSVLLESTQVAEVPPPTTEPAVALAAGSPCSS